MNFSISHSRDDVSEVGMSSEVGGSRSFSGNNSSQGPVSPTATGGPSATSSAAHITHGFSEMMSAGLRGAVASIKNPDSKDLQVYLKEERDVVAAQAKLLQQRRGATDWYINWAALKEEDIRAISAKIQQIQESFMLAEQEYVDALERARVRMKTIRDREKEISDMRAKLRSVVSKRDAAQKKQQPAEALIQEARDIHAHIRELEAQHLGATRFDLRETLRMRHEATLKYAAKMSVASKFQLCLADQIPQGTLYPGQNLPPYTGQSTLELIMNDFTTAFSSDELVTVVRTDVPAPTLLPSMPGLPSDAPTYETPDVSNLNGSDIEPAEVYAAPKPASYVPISQTPYSMPQIVADGGITKEKLLGGGSGVYYNATSSANSHLAGGLFPDNVERPESARSFSPSPVPGVPEKGEAGVAAPRTPPGLQEPTPATGTTPVSSVQEKLQLQLQQQQQQQQQPIPQVRVQYTPGVPAPPPANLQAPTAASGGYASVGYVPPATQYGYYTQYAPNYSNYSNQGGYATQPAGYNQQQAMYDYTQQQQYYQTQPQAAPTAQAYYSADNRQFPPPPPNYAPPRQNSS
ncbi:hypothetical protein HDU82_005318 [Entophlyctis luteolus]|nr:hypothetical protein HDU82_005318 [Entophlyctis luteolus]